MKKNSAVSLVRCDSYDREAVYQAVRAACSRIGGINKFVKRGEQVLIKPNILSARRPEEAVCTHPEVLRAVIRLVKETGANITVGDSPGGFLKNVEQVYDVSGISKVAIEERVNLVKFTFSRTIDGFPISARVLDADKIISIPKFKTHEITGLTGGIKNMYGAVVGLHKTKCHADAPREKDLAKIIVKVFSMVTPELSIVDGIVSMEGEGPSAGMPKKTDFIMAGADAVAVDSVLAVMVRTDPRDYAVIREAEKAGLGECDLGNIEILCDDFKSFIIKDFRHATYRMFLKSLPKIITNLIASELKFWPEIDSLSCKNCNLCKTSCPVRAVVPHGDTLKIDRHRCVRCMCCREICPYKAINVRKNWLARVFWE